MSASSAKNILRATVKGTIWNYSIFMLSKGVTFVSTMILARLLAPKDFGLLSLGLLAINYLEIFRELGVGSAVIYQQEEVERSSNVAFGMGVITNFILAGIAYLIAPWVADYFREPGVVEIIRVLAITLILSSLGSIHAVRLKKELDFRRIFIPEIGKTLVKAVISIGMALLGFGVWSLVYGQVGSILVATILYWWVSGWRPRLIFDWPIAHRLFGYSFQMILVSLFGMIHDNIDYLIIGRRLTSTDLGFYTMAFRVPELLIVNVCYVVSSALFPAFSKLQNDLATLQRGFLFSLRFVPLVTVPIGVGLFLITPEFVEIFLSEQWTPAIPVMQALSLYAAAYSIGFNSGDIFKATGHPDILNKIGIAKLAVAIPVLWIAGGYNILYVAISQFVLNSLLVILELGVVHYVIQVSWTEMMSALRPTFLATLFMFLGTCALRTQLMDFSALLRLLLLPVVGAALYAAGIWFMNREAALQLLQLVRTTFANKSNQINLEEAKG